MTKKKAVNYQAEYHALVNRLNDPAFVDDLHKRVKGESKGENETFTEPKPTMPEIDENMGPKEVTKVMAKYAEDLADWQDKKTNFELAKRDRVAANERKKAQFDSRLKELQEFQNAHEDFEELQYEIAEYVNKGYSLQDAYDLVKGRKDTARQADEGEDDNTPPEDTDGEGDDDKAKPPRTSMRSSDTDGGDKKVKEYKGDIRKAAGDSVASILNKHGVKTLD